MPLLLLIALLAGPRAQAPPKPEPPKKEAADPKSDPKLRDEDALDPKDAGLPRRLRDEADPAGSVKEYYPDPDQAKKEIEIGNFYMRKSSYTAAAKRFEEATKWQPNNALAFRRLGEALEKKDDPFRAAQAYKKALEIAPNAKDARDLKKKIEKLEKDAEK